MIALDFYTLYCAYAGVVGPLLMALKDLMFRQTSTIG
jgi:hypothetical protein